MFAPHSRFADVQSDLPCPGLVTLERTPPRRLLVMREDFAFAVSDENRPKNMPIIVLVEKNEPILCLSSVHRRSNRTKRGGGGVERDQPAW